MQAQDLAMVKVQAQDLEQVQELAMAKVQVQDLEQVQAQDLEQVQDLAMAKVQAQDLEQVLVQVQVTVPVQQLVLEVQAMHNLVPHLLPNLLQLLELVQVISL